MSNIFPKKVYASHSKLKQDYEGRQFRNIIYTTENNSNDVDSARTFHVTFAKMRVCYGPPNGIFLIQSRENNQGKHDGMAFYWVKRVVVEELYEGREAMFITCEPEEDRKIKYALLIDYYGKGETENG